MEKLSKFLSSTTGSVLVTTIICVLVATILIKISNKIINNIAKKSDPNEIHWKFIKNLLKAVIILIALYFITRQIPAFEYFGVTILTSSSLIVAVLGFAAQESLSNIIHGMFISIFHPFKIGDRIEIPAQDLIGWIDDISLRHTVIKTVKNTSVIVPNSVMDTVIIENSNYNNNRMMTFLDVLITYESDVDKAIEVMTNIIKNNPLTLDAGSEKKQKKGEKNVDILVRELEESGISLRASIWTKTINDSFKACSDIRREIVKQFEENGIEIAYPTVKILGKN